MLKHIGLSVTECSATTIILSKQFPHILGIIKAGKKSSCELMKCSALSEEHFGHFGCNLTVHAAVALQCCTSVGPWTQVRNLLKALCERSSSI